MSCAAVQVLYPGNGQQSDFLITFEYDFKSDVKVALWNSTTKEYDNLTEYSSGLADGTYYKYMEATIIRLVDQDDNPFAPRTPTVDPELGIAVPNIKIYRDTDITPMRATFYPGSSIRAQDLNSNFDQLRDALQESRCDLDNVEIWVDERFWNKTTDTVSSTETWVSDNAHVFTTAAADARFGQGGTGGGGASVIVSDTPPASVPLDGGGSRPLEPGDQWFNSDTGDLLVWYTDTDSSQWINVSHTGPAGPAGPPGPPGPGGGGVVDTITGTDPITVDSTDAANPVVAIDAATTTTVGAVQIETTVSNSATNVTTGSAVQAYAVRLNFSNLTVLP